MIEVFSKTYEGEGPAAIRIDIKGKWVEFDWQGSPEDYHSLKVLMAAKLSANSMWNKHLHIIAEEIP